MMDDVALVTHLLHHSSAKGKGRGTGQGDLVQALEVEAHGPHGVVKLSSSGLNVVGAVAAGDVLVVGSAIERYVTLNGSFASGVVVGGFIGVEYPAFVVDFHFTAKGVNIAGLLLRMGADSRGLVLRVRPHDLGW